MTVGNRRLNPRVLVLDGDSQASLTVVRSLGRRGLDVTVGAARPGSIGARSKYVDETFVYPEPADDPVGFVDVVAAALDGRDCVATIPTRDDTTTVVVEHQDRLAATGTTVGVAEPEQFELVADKATTFDLAADLSVPTPETRAPESVAEVQAFASELPYPVVVKSRSKHVWTDDGRLDTQEVGDENYAESPVQLVHTYRRLLRENPSFRETPPLVQEYVPGQTTTTVGVAEDGTFLTHFQERRLRTTPPSGGNSTLIRGFRDERLLEYAREVVDALSWTGPIQVEFMRTPDDDFALIEVNGRYWGSTPLAVASGVDVPAVHYALLTGADYEQSTTYRDDVIQQRLLYGDVKWLKQQLAAGNYWAAVPFVYSLARHDQVFVSTDDPVPTLAALEHAAELGVESVGKALGGHILDC